MFYFTLFLIGLCFGSFSSVIIHRLHQNESGILKGRSRCPHCRKTLKIKDLLPLVSYFISRGKCAYCRHRLSLLYPALEITMGGFFILTAYLTKGALWPVLIFYLFLTFVFVLLSAYDILFQEVPDEISLPTIVITGLSSYFLDLHSAPSLLLGLMVPVLFFGTLFVGSKGRWLGGGDVRIGGIMGFTLGWPHVLIGLFLGYLTGALFSVGGLLTKKLNRKSMIPFGPFLFAGTYLALFWGSDLLKWYLGWT